MTPNKPIHELKVGAIKATFWKNDTKNGDMVTVTFGRLYKDKADKWGVSNSYTKDDLSSLIAIVSNSMAFFAQAE